MLDELVELVEVVVVAAFTTTVATAFNVLPQPVIVVTESPTVAEQPSIVQLIT